MRLSAVTVLAVCACSAQPSAPRAVVGRPTPVDNSWLLTDRTRGSFPMSVATPFVFESSTVVRDGARTYRLSAPINKWDHVYGPVLSMGFPPLWDITFGDTILGCSGVVRCFFSSVPYEGTAKQWVADHAVGEVRRVGMASGDDALTYSDERWHYMLRWHRGVMYRLGVSAQSLPPDDFYLIMHTMQWRE